ncbi:proline-rich protein 36-like [Choloepus didactylus]|uniref:proline-rich protein 36-like n=1 Tax=Choloepus didactylus TaxID=27675 RepID=UPI00189F1DD4|nr:proline-rich protein 36-like [Choloepus didactylus]
MGRGGATSPRLPVQAGVRRRESIDRRPWAGCRKTPPEGHLTDAQEQEQGGKARGPAARRRGPKRATASPSGNRTPVSRVTGGDTHHYTNEDGNGPFGPTTLAGCPPDPFPRRRRRPTPRHAHQPASHRDPDIATTPTPHHHHPGGSGPHAVGGWRQAAEPARPGWVAGGGETASAAETAGFAAVAPPRPARGRSTRHRDGHLGGTANAQGHECWRLIPASRAATRRVSPPVLEGEPPDPRRSLLRPTHPSLTPAGEAQTAQRNAAQVLSVPIPAAPFAYVLSMPIPPSPAFPAHPNVPSDPHRLLRLPVPLSRPEDGSVDLWAEPLDPRHPPTNVGPHPTRANSTSALPCRDSPLCPPGPLASAVGQKVEVSLTRIGRHTGRPSAGGRESEARHPSAFSGEGGYGRGTLHRALRLTALRAPAWPGPAAAFLRGTPAFSRPRASGRAQARARLPVSRRASTCLAPLARVAHPLPGRRHAPPGALRECRMPAAGSDWCRAAGGERALGPSVASPGSGAWILPHTTRSAPASPPFPAPLSPYRPNRGPVQHFSGSATPPPGTSPWIFSQRSLASSHLLAGHRLAPLPASNSHLSLMALGGNTSSSPETTRLPLFPVWAPPRPMAPAPATATHRPEASAQPLPGPPAVFPSTPSKLGYPPLGRLKADFRIDVSRPPWPGWAGLWVQRPSPDPIPHPPSPTAHRPPPTAHRHTHRHPRQHSYPYPRTEEGRVDAPAAGLGPLEAATWRHSAKHVRWPEPGGRGVPTADRTRKAALATRVLGSQESGVSETSVGSWWWEKPQASSGRREAKRIGSWPAVGACAAKEGASGRSSAPPARAQGATLAPGPRFAQPPPCKRSPLTASRNASALACCLLAAPSKHCAPLSHPSTQPRAKLPPRTLAGWSGPPAKCQSAALAGNRTRVNCLEGSYAHHYTTNAARPGQARDAGPGLARALCRRRQAQPFPDVPPASDPTLPQRRRPAVPRLTRAVRAQRRLSGRSRCLAARCSVLGAPCSVLRAPAPSAPPRCRPPPGHHQVASAAPCSAGP